MRILLPLITIICLTLQAADENFYLDENGVTIHCENAAVYESGIADGKIYTKIASKYDLVVHGGDYNATDVCTSGITDMCEFKCY